MTYTGFSIIRVMSSGTGDRRGVGRFQVIGFDFAHSYSPGQTVIAETNTVEAARAVLMLMHSQSAHRAEVTP